MATTQRCWWCDGGVWVSETEMSKKAKTADGFCKGPVFIRPTNPLDLPFVLNAERAPENSPFVVNWSEEKHQASLADPDVHHVVVFRTGTETPVGYVILRGLCDPSGPIELKRLLIVDKGKGLGRSTLELIKEFVFDQLKRRRLWLNVLPNNRRARNLYQSTGFRYEGTWRDSFKTDDGYADLELMTILATDRGMKETIELDGHVFDLVRTFSRKQLQQYFDLYDQQWPNSTRTHQDLENALLGSEFFLGLIETMSHDLVGFCRVVSDRGFRAWIHGLIVRTDWRGKGLGRLMMERVLESKELNGIHSVSLTCAPKMNPFYAKWGFEIFENETVMRLNLRPSGGMGGTV